MGTSEKGLPETIIMDLAASFYGLSLIILFVDTMYYLRPGIAYTVGRVTVIGVDNFTVFGTILLDQIVFWAMAMLLSSAITVFTGRKQYLFITLICAVSFFAITYTAKQATLMPSILAAIALSIALVQWRDWRLIPKSIVYGLGVFEFLKIIYLASKALTGIYPRLSPSVYTNIVISYYLWFIIPVALCLIIFYGVARTLYDTGVLSYILKRIHSHVSMFWRKLIEPDEPVNKPGSGTIISKYLLIGLVLSLVVGILPYLPTLNPRGISVNTDWIYYYNWLKQMVDGDFSPLYKHSDRPLYLLFLYSIWSLVKTDPRTLAIYHNIVLLPLYTFSTYLLALKWAGKKTADMVALITPFSPIFLSFVYGGFQANLMAISLVFTSIYLVMSGSKRSFFAGLLLFLLTMFVHEWTWTQYMIVLTVYVFLRILRTRLNLRRLDWRDKALLCFIVFSYIVDFGKQCLFNMFSSAIVAEKAIAMASPMPYVDSIHWYVTIYTGGTLNNPLFYATAVLGLNLVGLSIPGLATILSLLPTVMPWKVITYRLILNTPITILAAQGLCKTGEKTRLLLLVSLMGIGLWRLYSIIPGLSLS